MVEWSITAVLKTVELRGSGGSNPSLSARNAEFQQITRFTHNLTHTNAKVVRIFIVFGFIFKFYSDDHTPVHVHVI